jgi:hypothetical protein
MSDGQRYRRADPDRDAPVRKWSQILRPSAAAADSGVSPPTSASTDVTAEHDRQDRRDGFDHPSANGAGPAHPADETITEGVAIAYRVIEEHLRAGQRAAEQTHAHNRPGDSPAHNGAGASHHAAANGSTIASVISSAAVEDLIAQGVRFYSNLLPLWVDFFNSLAASGATDEFFKALRTSVSSDGFGRPDHDTPAVTIEVASRRPAQVALDLRPRADLASLAIAGLRTLDPDKRALTEVAFVAGPDRRILLRIHVPDTHPAGLYTGVIVDRATGDPRGTLSVRVGE